MNNLEGLYGHPWTEPEYVIALHYYFLHRDSPRHKDSDFVKEAAELLGRTPASIVMRLENFASLDVEAGLSRKGLSNSGPICREVFLRWKDHRDHLKSCAEMLIRDRRKPRNLSLFEPERWEVPKALRRYELLEEIGEGGFGSVFSCVDVETGKLYALKIIKAQNRFDPETLHRFRREMRILRSVQHEHVIRLHNDNLDTEESFPAFVMDLAKYSLAQHLEYTGKDRGSKRPFLPIVEATNVFRSIASAVHALHSHVPKVVHRDINPHNILLMGNGFWILADFGLAKFVKSAATGSTFATRPGPGWGFGYYAAPEQFQDFTKTDERTDIYALGVLLWELFTKGLPPPDPANPELPEGLARVYVKAAVRNHEARYQSVAEMLVAFNDAIGDIMRLANAVTAGL